MLALGEPRGDVTGYPVQISKVQPPPLRDDTLARPRLLDWLAAKIHNRLVLLIADAGYGKTTLLADFSRRSRVRTLWYRLDDTDRSWGPFLAHLVAAGREHDAGFAPNTFQLLRELGPAGPSLDTVLNTFLRELPAFSASGVALVLDDFHLVDDSDEATGVVRELISRAPERLTLVIASRRRPVLPLARLRSLGEVAELGVSDLRFDVNETASLFRDAYRHPLDNDTVAELTRRTEGWAASLQLVQAAVRDRSPRETRAFIRSLSGAEGDLYDYLAEEVIGHLSPEMQDFLMRTSLLETVEPDLAAIVAGVDAASARNLMASAERFGLLSRRGVARGTFRFHPLVREFLLVRVAREEDPGRIRELHREVARACQDRDWRRAVFHFGEAGEWAAASRLLTESLGQILAAGEFDVAQTHLMKLPTDQDSASFFVIQSRSAYRKGHVDEAMEHARAAAEADPESEVAALNLLSLSFTSRDLQGASRLASVLADGGRSEAVRTMAGLYVQLLGSSTSLSLETAVDAFVQAAERHRAAGNRHYEGIALTNAAVMLRSVGDDAAALRVASDALAALDESSAGPERASARMVRAWALAHQGLIDDARLEAEQAHLEGGAASMVEVCLELSDIEIWYGELVAARRSLDQIPEDLQLDNDQSEQRYLTLASYYLRSGEFNAASDSVSKLRLGQPSTAAGMEARRLSCLAHTAVALQLSDATNAIAVARSHAAAQSAAFWTDYAVLLDAISGDRTQMNRAIRAAFVARPASISILAELLMARFDDLDKDVLDLLVEEVQARPDRWRELLRLEVSRSGTTQVQRFAARRLDAIGEKEDVLTLRTFARSLRGNGPDNALGRQLSRRLADSVFIHDQNRVAISIGARLVQGADVRRKALALLCYLLTRPDFAATRDEVLEALWPDMDPSMALNSLNQTIYFLRRILESDFAEDTSPGYLRYQSDVVWLDASLVDSESARYRRVLAGAAKPPTPSDVEAISRAYSGRFALDFAYEDWAADYRESLHAAYLAVVEESVRNDAMTGHFDRGAGIARRAIEIDPEAHQIERLLVKVYRLAGAHAAAAEQYGHYAAAVREDLGVEPSRIEDL